MEELDAEALISILSLPKNALVKQYNKLFAMEGVQLEFRDAALSAIASKALERKSGARGLRSIMENTLLDIMYHLPDMQGISKVVIDEGVIKGESEPLYIYEKSDSSKAAAD